MRTTCHKCVVNVRRIGHYMNMKRAHRNDWLILHSYFIQVSMIVIFNSSRGKQKLQNSIRSTNFFFFQNVFYPWAFGNVIHIIFTVIHVYNFLVFFSFFEQFLFVVSVVLWRWLLVGLCFTRSLTLPSLSLLDTYFVLFHVTHTHTFYYFFNNVFDCLGLYSFPNSIERYRVAPSLARVQ